MKERLKQLRKSKKLSQQKVAKAIGITAGAYGNYEQGTRKPSIETLIKLSKFYGVSVDYIIGKDDINNRMEKQLLTSFRLLSEEDKQYIMKEVKGCIDNYDYLGWSGYYSHNN